MTFLTTQSNAIFNQIRQNIDTFNKKDKVVINQMHGTCMVLVVVASYGHTHTHTCYTPIITFLMYWNWLQCATVNMIGYNFIIIRYFIRKTWGKYIVGFHLIKLKNKF